MKLGNLFLCFTNGAMLFVNNKDEEMKDVSNEIFQPLFSSRFESCSPETCNLKI